MEISPNWEGDGQVLMQAGVACQLVVYETSWCGYCEKIKDLLNDQGVGFLEKDRERRGC